jgi:hypothetical protein
MILVADDSEPGIKCHDYLAKNGSTEAVLLSKITSSIPTIDLKEVTRKTILKNQFNSATSGFANSDRSDIRKLRNRENRTVTTRTQTLKLENLPTEFVSGDLDNRNLTSRRQIAKVKMSPSKIVGRLPKTHTNRMF